MYVKLLLLYLLAFAIQGCALLEATGKIASAAGTIFSAAGYTVGKTVEATGKIVSTLIELPSQKKVIPLHRQGRSFLVDALVNKKVKAQLLLDTGAVDTQLSSTIIKQLGIPDDMGEPVTVRVAGGMLMKARAVTLKELRVGGVRAYNIRALVLNTEASNAHDGLLGMSFLNNFVFSIDAEKGELILERPK